MKGIQFLLTLLLVPGLPLFQIDQAVDIEWLVCENCLLIKSEMNGPFINHDLCFNLKPSTSLFNQVKNFFQLKNPLSVLLSYFQGTSPFWRPPPVFHPSLF